MVWRSTPYAPLHGVHILSPQSPLHAKNLAGLSPSKGVFSPQSQRVSIGRSNAQAMTAGAHMLNCQLNREVENNLRLRDRKVFVEKMVVRAMASEGLAGQTPKTAAQQAREEKERIVCKVTRNESNIS
eukprot:gb/GEZN01008227.1/.p2 GENE.gb/GEZN01008227.1/~~gb/GEZN01008227.1/.p2  ORF type:complete len:128 (+),score=6.21 gb/GEZN01008227.1/:738-1121(+)